MEAELAARNQARRRALTAWNEAVAEARRLASYLRGLNLRRFRDAGLEPNRYPHHATVLFRE